jgi:multidrug efflux pump subunit AcrB
VTVEKGARRTIRAPRVLFGGGPVPSRGVLVWFANNRVAANVLMLIFIGGGLLQLCTIKQEVFPEVSLDAIVINVPYPGASPDDVEKGVTLVTEEAVRGLEGVKRVTSTSGEGYAVLTVELELGVDSAEALNRVRAAIDRITTYPESVEKPMIFEAINRFRVLSLVVSGDLPGVTGEEEELHLKEWAERIRTDLLARGGISTVELSGVRQLEISIEIAQETLRRYRLTLDQVAAIVRATCVEVPAGRIKTREREILLRTAARCNDASDIRDVVVVAQPDGTELRLGDLARISDGFADTDQVSYFNGERAVMIDVYRVGQEKPLDVSRLTRDYLEELEPSLPAGLEVAEWLDISEIYADRMSLMLRNAWQGLLLVIILLGLFLELRLAFWVTLGIPISFIGSALFLPSADVSINMLSLFAFILVLGMVVDDAISVGESVHRYRAEGYSRIHAAILGVREIWIPITFAIITTIIAYSPMLFVPGVMGKFFRQIPIVVIACLLISLVESLLILPAHLAGSRESRRGPVAWIDRQQGKVARGFEWLVAHWYVPLVAMATRRRYLTLSISLALLLTTCGLVGGGHIRITPMPEIESDQITFEARLPFGTSAERTSQLEAAMVDAARRIMEEHGGEARLSRGIFSMVGGSIMGGGPGGFQDVSGGHIALVMVYLVPIDERTIRAAEFARLWEDALADYPGLDSMQLNYTTGFSAGDAIDFELSHPDPERLKEAASRLAVALRDYRGVRQINDGYTDGKPQLNLTLAPSGRAAGLTAADLARTVRGAFFGAEALRIQRGRDEVRAYVRLPEAERVSEHAFEELIVRTPSGAEMPIGAVARVERGESYTEIKRRDGRRSVSVTADVDQALGNAGEVIASLEKRMLPALREEMPQLTWRIGGEQREFQEGMGSLALGMLAAVGVMFALMAVLFRSYVQPIVVLFAIPFGFVGAVIGHIIMGFSFSLMSMMGLVALSGVAINDSLVLVDAINRRRAAGVPTWRACIEAGSIRCRPIFLTSATTFFGLMPLITETSVQARFMVPMAVSLAFGILLSTLVTLVVVPCFYLMIEDIRFLLRRGWFGPGTPR